MPPVVTALLLIVITNIQSVPFDPQILGLTVLASVLSLVILRPDDATIVPVLRPLTTALGVLARWLVLLGFLLAVGYVAGFSNEFPRRAILPWAVLTPVALVAFSLLLTTLMRRVVLSQENLRTAVIAGLNQSSLPLASKLKSYPELCMKVLGFFDDRGKDRLGSLVEHEQHLGGLADVADFVRANHVDVIFIALPIRHIQRVMDLLDDLHDTTASLYYVPDVFVFDLIQSRTSELMGVPIVAMCETPFQGYKAVMKRVTDVVLTLSILVPTSIVMLVIAVLIKLTSRGPTIFRQRRYGLDGKEIVVYKFRTMHVVQDGGHIPQATRNDPRITTVGRFLRRYSLDELPQLFNVLEGKMSLVGPRPHAVAHNEEYRRVIKGYMIRHKVLPGITGLAQVSGYRGETSDVEQMRARVRYDLDYLRHWTPALDVRILFQTALQIFRDGKAY
jgi:putative colanic acid biosynthesis UDP-glucose lipid carrier transferase